MDSSSRWTAIMCTSSHVQPVILIPEANKIVEVFSPLEETMFCRSPAYRTIHKAVHSERDPNCKLWCIKIPSGWSERLRLFHIIFIITDTSLYDSLWYKDTATEKLSSKAKWIYLSSCSSAEMSSGGRSPVTVQSRAWLTELHGSGHAYVDRKLVAEFSLQNINNTSARRKECHIQQTIPQNTHQLILRLTAPSHSRKSSGVHETLFPWRSEESSDGHNRSFRLWVLRVGLHFSYAYWDRRTFRCPSRSEKWEWHRLTHTQKTLY